MTVFEEVINLRGQKVERVKSSFFYLLAFVATVSSFGCFAYDKVGFGVFLLLTVVPISLLYPAIRFFFGGKDSLAAVATTIVVEEVIKHNLQSSSKKGSRSNSSRLANAATAAVLEVTNRQISKDINSK